MTDEEPARKHLPDLRPGIWWRGMLSLWKADQMYRADLSTALFTTIRRRLTLSYTAVLAAILVLLSLLLYFGTQTTIYRLGQAREYHSAQSFALAWQRHGTSPCTFSSNFSGKQAPSNNPPSGGHSSQFVPYRACYSASGQPEGSGGPFDEVPGFLSSSLALQALHSRSGSASDTIVSGNGFGIIARYALVVNGPTGQPLGVVQVGRPVSIEATALNALAIVLLAVDLLGIAVAGIAGMALSHRALAPARLAFARQQSFIADASHELRTPMTLMRADAELLLRARDRLDEDDVVLLEDIVDEVEHMGQLTTNLLTLARLDAHATPMEHSPVDLAEVAEGIVRRVQALANNRQVRVSFASESRDPVLALGNQSLLDQAMLILVDNAIKYNRPGGTVHVTVAQAHGQATVRVHDTGIGIPAEHLSRLGERFYRVDKARSREMGGSGLGLSIARGVAGQHAGTLTLESTPEQGTTATITLPAVPLHSHYQTVPKVEHTEQSEQSEQGAGRL